MSLPFVRWTRRPAAAAFAAALLTLSFLLAAVPFASGTSAEPPRSAHGLSIAAGTPPNTHRTTDSTPSPRASASSSSGPSTLPPPPGSVTVYPGAANLTVSWNGSGTNATAYLVLWGVEGAPAQNMTVNGSVTTALLAPLLAYVPYDVRVASENASGVGNASAAVRVMLTPWTLIRGTVTPANASVSVDDVGVPVVLGAFQLNTSFLPHVVSASLTDYASAAVALDPAWNGSVWANFTLDLLPGTVEGYLFPAIANLSWNGGLVVVNGAGFFQFSAPPNATGTLAASYQGLVSQNVSVAVPANRTVWVNLTLAPPNGSLWFSVSPAVAEVWLDGVPISLDAAGNATLSSVPGIHAVKVLLTGYLPNFQNVTVRSGLVTFVVVTLHAISNGTDTNGTGSPGGLSLSDPLTLGLIVAVLVVALVVGALALRERRRPPEISSRVPEPPQVVDAELVGTDETLP